MRHSEQPWFGRPQAFALAPELSTALIQIISAPFEAARAYDILEDDEAHRTIGREDVRVMQKHPKNSAMPIGGIVVAVIRPPGVMHMHSIDASPEIELLSESISELATSCPAPIARHSRRATGLPLNS